MLSHCLRIFVTHSAVRLLSAVIVAILIPSSSFNSFIPNGLYTLYIYSGYFVLLSCIVVAVTLYVCRNISKNANKNNKSHQKIKEDG